MTIASLFLSSYPSCTCAMLMWSKCVIISSSAILREHFCYRRPLHVWSTTNTESRIICKSNFQVACGLRSFQPKRSAKSLKSEVVVEIICAIYSCGRAPTMSAQNTATDKTGKNTSLRETNRVETTQTLSEKSEGYLSKSGNFLQVMPNLVIERSLKFLSLQYLLLFPASMRQ